MSYRALLSIQNVTASGTVLHSQDFRMIMDEDFTNGERIAEMLGKNRDRGEAISQAILLQDLTGTTFEGGLQREKWIEAYADQVWQIQYCESEGYTRVQIKGFDAGMSLIFFRSTVYG